MEAVVFYLVKVWQELGSSFLCLQVYTSAHQSPQYIIRAWCCHFSAELPCRQRQELPLLFRCILAWWSLSVPTPGGCLQPPGLWGSMQFLLPNTVSPVLSVPLKPYFVAHLMPDTKPCCYLSGKCSSGMWSTGLRDITAALQPLPCNIVLTLMKSLWCRSMYWKISVSNAEEDEEDIPSLKGSSRVRWTVSES